MSDSPATEQPSVRFADLGLNPAIQQAIQDVGYETPSPIQAQSIPPLLEGRDLIGMAQTGTGKTAAFSLPLLSRIDTSIRAPQMLVLAPTRELAIQVAEAMANYARHLPDFHIAPIYGGQAMFQQRKLLDRGVHVVVGTPGRIQDHLRRGTLQFDQIRMVVLDEADEMLRMGFIDDVDAILAEVPAERQVALFSATMPEPIRRIAQRHLRDPQEIKIKATTSTVSSIRQRFWPVSGMHKPDALTRILEVEDFDAGIIFVRTRQATNELAERLAARGYSAAALSGEMGQAEREKTVDKLKNGQLDLVVATDVAARGLDVPRISHVINYDIPYDTEAYVHRIGRTGRAGRSGEAILFVTPREKRMLKAIERATRQPIEQMRLPSATDIASRRSAQLKDQITAVREAEDLTPFVELLNEYQNEHDIEMAEVAGALAFLLQKDRPVIAEQIKEMTPPPAMRERDRDDRGPRDDSDKIRYRISVGREHGVTPGNIVGALTNEGGIHGKQIGAIEIESDHSFVDLPAGMPDRLIQQLSNIHLFGIKLALQGMGPAPAGRPRRRPRPGGHPGKGRPPKRKFDRR
ncbi:DEAD/DEAH box helicase [Guyparkeria hydrothermalis]|uniref:DEAD/DEAH box helicase n=1 Tax=Guyparkeria hydrothermalis TaxID=923 RepID=UPI00201FCD30|nr:DEAD/DEAH box helicase [Guyparkeria hydrothermalis]MCL7743727.1 DEAD/DEAH box helicase [Guyparkeria hydrothermalis]